MTPTPEQMIAFKAILRKRCGNRCEAIWPEIVQWRFTRDQALPIRCYCVEGNSPPCLHCNGDGLFDCDKDDPHAIHIGDVWTIPCPICLAYGRDIKAPAIALKFHRLRGVAGEINTNDVIMLCAWCSKAMTARPELAARIKLETVRVP